MISICIATYNGEKHIKEQLDSILCQLGENDEIIISDDGSTDKTLEIIKNYTDRRIKLFLHEKDSRLLKKPSASFRFAAMNFENAINKAKGDFIYLSDQDDIWMQNRVETVQSLLMNYDLVMCNYKVIDDAGKIVIEQFYDKNPVNKSLLKNVANTPFLGCCMSFRRNVLDYSLPFPKACIGHDFWLGCLILKLGTFKYVEKPLHLYRKHSNNVSPIIEKSKNKFLFKIQYRIKFTYDIVIYIIGYTIRKKKKKNESMFY